MSALGNFTYAVVVLIAVLTVVVFIHEMGHFLIARRCGVKVEAFSIGFGREIWGFTDRLGTRWKIAWIPLGGYVKFIDDENSASVPSRDALERLTPEQRAGAFHAKPLAQRAAIIAAGPAFNIISAVLIFTLTFWALGSYRVEAIVDTVEPQSAAARAGLRPGDKITLIDDQVIESYSDLQRVIRQSTSPSHELTIIRDHKTHTLTVTPELREIPDPLGNKIRVRGIGIGRTNSPNKVQHRSHGLLDAAGMALQETGQVAYQIISSIPKLPGAILKVYSGQSQSEIGGPIAIAEMSAQASRSGIGALLAWIAVFSIMLGIMNLLPIPLLDGGHLLMCGLEAIRGKPLDEHKQELSYKIGLALIVTMMFAAIIGDFMRKFGLT